MRESPAYKELKAAWDSGLDGEVRRCTWSFLILVVIALVVHLMLPELRDRAVSQIVSLMAGKDLTTASGHISFLALFVNNVQACALIMLYGLIPYIRLSAIPLGLNTALIGVLAANSVVRGELLMFLVGILPHGIFELPALVLAFAMSLFVCGQVTRRCKKDQSAISTLNCIVLISRFLFLVLIPLLFIAALIEAWVTPALLLLFQ